jgi:hypothetical protein
MSTNPLETPSKGRRSLSPRARSKPEPSPEFNRFERLTKRLLQVPKKEINGQGQKAKKKTSR